MCHGFKCEQEPILSYKSRTLINYRESGLWVIAYPELVLRFCATILMAAYVEYRLWYVPPDITAFDRELGTGIANAL